MSPANAGCPSDIEIARSTELLPIRDIADSVGLLEDDLEPYGRHKAKINLSVLDRLSERPDGKLVLVTGITPTPAGEGKTVTSIGLSQALWRTGKKAMLCLREPSLGPTFGMKGGAAGGGYSQVLPMDEINLHFTGDLHAITAAHNLLAAMIDNHVHHGNALNVNRARVVWPRALDVADRQLRNIVIGLGGRTNGWPREDGFVITAASEIMAVLALARDPEDLRERLGRIVVAFDQDGGTITPADLQVTGSMMVLLRDALKPNLVQTIERTPALVHAGPFANIAHGCNSIMATRLGLKLGDICISEAGFGSDLGAEKFFDIKCRLAGLSPEAVVIVATCRALKMHGGVKLADINEPNPDAMLQGAANLRVHVENIRKFGVPPVVAINQFPSDTPEELSALEAYCREFGVPAARSKVAAEGGAGGVELAERVLEVLEAGAAKFQPLYNLEDPIKTKVEILARQVYRADGVDFSPAAQRQIRVIERLGLDKQPICIAKTQLSLSDDKKQLGVPKGWRLNVQDIQLRNGAGFLVVVCGDMLLMPGLPKSPAAEKINLLPDGNIVGLF